MLLALTLVSSRGLTSPTAPVFASPLRCAGVRCSDPERKAVFSEERSESVKAGGIASLTGTMASAPVKASAVLATLPVKATALASWQISTCVFAVQLFLFGIVYRCTVRCDDNDALRQGAVGAAALCRALGLMQTNNAWTGDRWLQLGLSFGESALAFGVAAAALEFAWDKGYGRRLPGLGLPPDFEKRLRREEKRILREEKAFAKRLYDFEEKRMRDGPPPPYRDEPPRPFLGEPPPPRFYRDETPPIDYRDGYRDGYDGPPPYEYPEDLEDPVVR